jgi:hypothetical protein
MGLESVRIPIYGPKYSVRRTQVGLSFFALLGALLILAVGGPIPKITLGALVLILAGVVILVTRLDNALAAREIRFESVSGRLGFVGARGIWTGSLVLGIVGIVPGAAALLLRESTEPIRSVLPILAFSLLALGLVMQQLRGLAAPTGLRLDVTGVRGVRGSKRLDFEWNEIAGASTQPSTGLAQLVVTSVDGSAVAIDPRYFGSDPNIVALVINYFVAHPDQRSALVDPKAALALVEAAQSPAGDPR